MLFFPRRVRLICFFIVTPWELGVIFTANYTFLNYLVLSLGFLLLDDKSLLWLIPARFRPREPERAIAMEFTEEQPISILAADDRTAAMAELERRLEARANETWRTRLTDRMRMLRLLASSVMLCWIAYNTTAEMIGLLLRHIPLPTAPITALDPLRIANQYGLFAVMTRGRYEIEFQGSNDGTNWTAYPFRNKPQALNEPPRIYAPYQPRFDWNLWFASLGDWQQNDFVTLTEERLLVNSPAVLSLFKDNPFPGSPPRYVRAVLWQYWFTSIDEKRSTGNWWRREYLGLYAPEIAPAASRDFTVVQWPDDLPLHD
jgi:hypothetical protein